MLYRTMMIPPISRKPYAMVVVFAVRSANNGDDIAILP
jgi:hypothetical protein